VKDQNFLFILGFVLAVAAIGVAQDVPKIELAGGYSHVNSQPGLSAITSPNINGGGGSFVYNLTRLIGIKADFMGYAVAPAGPTS